VTGQQTGDREDGMSEAKRSADGPKDTVLIVVHQKTSTPGRVGMLLEERGYKLERRCPCLGCDLPANLSEYAAVVVFGGPMSANDGDCLDGINREIRHVDTVLEAGVPYFGICLGAQILATALGGSVDPHPERHVEVGYTKVIPTENAGDLFEHSTHFYQFHREGFEVPRSAELLAAGTNSFPNQAFRYGDKAYGIQFHPEITIDMIHRWNMGGAHRLMLPGAQPKRAQVKGWELFDEGIRRWTLGMFDRLGLPDLKASDRDQAAA